MPRQPKSAKQQQQEELRRLRRSPDVLSRMHRDIVGPAVRIHVPLLDVIDLRRISRHLRALANELEVLSHSPEETWVVLSVAKTKIKATGSAIRSEAKL